MGDAGFWWSIGYCFDNAPSSPTHGDMWWESDTGDLKIYYDESETGAGSGAFWVSANGADSMVGISTSANKPSDRAFGGTLM